MVLVAALWPCVSFAAKPGAKSGDPAAKVDTTKGDAKGAPDADVEKAREHLRKAGVHYDLQEFRKALTEFREAYRLKNDPVILFDMGQCDRKLGHYREAIDFYKSYLRKVPSVSNRAEAERLIAESEKQLKENPPEPSAPASGSEKSADKTAEKSADKTAEKSAEKPSPPEGGLGTGTLPLGPPMRRHRRGRFHPDGGAGAGDPSSGQ
jgi:tetratricopeptide (TPR) repeat protein